MSSISAEGLSGALPALSRSSWLMPPIVAGTVVGVWFGKIVTAVPILIRDDDPWFNPPSSHRPFLYFADHQLSKVHGDILGPLFTAGSLYCPAKMYKCQPRKCSGLRMSCQSTSASASPKSPRACARISDNHFQTLTDTFSISAVANSYIELHKQAV
jgi:hypothetical protein